MTEFEPRISGVWIWTADLWCLKRLRYQLSHNRCPHFDIFIRVIGVRVLVVCWPAAGASAISAPLFNATWKTLSKWGGALCVTIHRIPSSIRKIVWCTTECTKKMKGKEMTPVPSIFIAAKLMKISHPSPFHRSIGRSKRFFGFVSCSCCLRQIQTPILFKLKSFSIPM